MTVATHFSAPVALLESQLTSGAIRVWIWAAGHPSVSASPCGVETMAKRLGVSDKSVRRALIELEAAGWLTAERAPGRPPTYKFQVVGEA